MKHVPTITVFLFFAVTCCGQTTASDTSNYSKTINEQAVKMGQLLIKKDFYAFTGFTYPKIVEMMGGKEKMAEVLEKGSKEMAAQGIEFLNVSFGDPSKIINQESELQCTLPQTIEMKVPNGRLVANSTLIAISSDDGKNWYFIDTSGKDLRTMKNSFPNLSSELVIPGKKEPIFYKD